MRGYGGADGRNCEVEDETALVVVARDYQRSGVSPTRLVGVREARMPRNNPTEEAA